MSVLETVSSVESPTEFGTDAAGVYKRWAAEIGLARKEFKKWTRRVEKITKRYRDDGRGGLEAEVEAQDYENGEKLNLLWSTVQTQIPAIYQFPPKVEVSRRFKSKNPVARCASMILERYVEIDMDRDGFDGEVLSVLLDRCLGARGQMWVEYEPIIGKIQTPVPVQPGPVGGFVTMDGQPYEGAPPQPGPDGSLMGAVENEDIVDCRAPANYVYWSDFLHSAARRWVNVTWVARRRFYTKDKCATLFAKGMKEFGWVAKDLPLTREARIDQDRQGEAILFKQVEVWELWSDKEVVFISLGMQVPLEVKPRPIKFKTSKWPCPQPFYGTLTNDTLVPVPDYCQWQKLAEEVDELTERIKNVTRAIKVLGARPASMVELDELLSDARENDLIAVQNWQSFKQDGGLEGAISWLPVEPLMKVLAELTVQRQNRIDFIFQLNGIADIMRGQGDPRATATQDRIKDKFGSLRLGQMQQDLASFVERVIRIKAEIICEKAPQQVMVTVSGIDDVPEMAENVQAAVAMLKDDTIRDYRIDVDERSMVALQDEADKAERVEFSDAMGKGIDTIMKASMQAPQVLDIAAQAVLWTARGFRVGRDMEGALEAFIQQTQRQAEAARKQAAENPPKPPVDPLQVEAVKAQNAANVEGMKSQNALALEDKRHNYKLEEIQRTSIAENEQEKAQALSEQAIEQVRTAGKERLAELDAKLELFVEAQAQRNAVELEKYKADLKAEVNARQAEQKQRDDALMGAIRAPRRRKLLLDEAGEPVGAMDEVDE